MALSVWALLSGCETSSGCGTSGRSCVIEVDVGICTCGSRPILERQVASLPRSPKEVADLIPVEVHTSIDACDPMQTLVRFTFDPIQPEQVNVFSCYWNDGRETMYVVEASGHLAVEGDGESWVARFPSITVLAFVPANGVIADAHLQISGRLSRVEIEAQAGVGSLGARLDSAREDKGWTASDDQLFAVLDAYVFPPNLATGTLTSFNLRPADVNRAPLFECPHDYFFDYVTWLDCREFR